MKTAQGVEEMAQRKADEKGNRCKKTDGENGAFIANVSEPVSEGRRRSMANLVPHRWPKGVSGNPKGINTHPEKDLAAQIARSIFEEDGPAIRVAFMKMLRRGSPYAFATLADRAYGKMKETVAVDVNPLRDVSTEDLEARCEELQRQLGLVKALPAVSDDSKVN